MPTFQYYKRILSAYLFNKKQSNLSFWHTPLSSNSLGEEDINTVRKYPQNFIEKTKFIGKLDEEGIPLLNYYGNIGYQYNPNAIAQIALGYYDRILSGEDCINKFLNHASYFLKHRREIDSDIILWEYNFPFEIRGITLPGHWHSALAQSQGISVCIRAYALTNNELYIIAAKKAFNAFRYLIREHTGGVLDDSGGFIWPEEYILSPANHVLNGFIWSLWGIRDYSVFTQDPYAVNLWSSCLRTLKENLQYYDLGFWTSYDLLKYTPKKYPIMPASLYYQNLHIVQMQSMYNLTKDILFYNFEKRWKSQLNNVLYILVSQLWKSYFKLRWF